MLALMPSLNSTAQGGTPLEEGYNHLTRANLWLASSIWECEVP